MTLPLPVRGDAVEFAGIQYVLNFDFGIQLYEKVVNYVDSHGIDKNWFEHIQASYELKKLPRYDDPKDPRFLLKEAVFHGSPIRPAFPGLAEHTELWVGIARELREAMNFWSHHKILPSHDTFLGYLAPFSELATLCGLPVSHDAQRVIQRVRDLKEGKTFSSPATEQLPPAAQEYAKRVSEEIEREKIRPPLGGEWIGDIGQRRVHLNRALRDVTEQGNSIKSEFGQDAEEKIANLLRNFPLGSDLYIDDDGAIMGYKKGTAFLLEWLGEEPSVNKAEPRGFYTQHKYQFDNTDILELESQTKLSSVAQESISNLLNGLRVWGLKQGDIFRVSIYGDVVYTDQETDKEHKVTHVHKGNWFPGHLPG
jgi:hypothetical protein